VFCQWLPTKYVSDPQFVPNILCTHEAVSKIGSIVYFHNAHVWEDENPPHHRRFKILISIFHPCLSGHHRTSALRAIFLTRQTDRCSVPSGLFNHLPALWQYMRLHQQHMWSMHYVEPNGFFLAVRTWNRHSVDSGQDVEAPSTWGQFQNQPPIGWLKK